MTFHRYRKGMAWCWLVAVSVLGLSWGGPQSTSADFETGCYITININSGDLSNYCGYQEGVECPGGCISCVNNALGAMMSYYMQVSPPAGLRQYGPIPFADAVLCTVTLRVCEYVEDIFCSYVCEDAATQPLPCSEFPYAARGQNCS